VTSERTELLPDASIDDLIADRDLAQDMADRLAEALARLLGVEIGEHSSMNDPWANALRAAADHRARPAEEAETRRPAKVQCPTWGCRAERSHEGDCNVPAGGTEG
jgi:hypothetical protein